MTDDMKELQRLGQEYDAANTAAIAERNAPSGWRNISTAPKDGTRVLIVCMKASKATKSRQGQMAVDFWHTIKDNGYDGWGLFNASYFPATHWMPLPAPPHQRENVSV